MLDDMVGEWHTAPEMDILSPDLVLHEGNKRFVTIMQDNNGKNVSDQIFRLDLMVGY